MDVQIYPMQKSTFSTKSNNTTSSKESIKKNPVIYSDLDNDGAPKTIQDIYSLLISWCNDQSCLYEETPPTPPLTKESVEEEESKRKESFCQISQNTLKGTIQLHYDEENTKNYVEFCVDSDTFYKNLLNDNKSDRIEATDPFFSKVCYFFFTRNLIRLAAILAIYNIFIESLKGTMAKTDNIAMGYYGNVIGDICIIWGYGWGYYIYHGTFVFNFN